MCDTAEKPYDYLEVTGSKFEQLSQQFIRLMKETERRFHQTGSELYKEQRRKRPSKKHLTSCYDRIWGLFDLELRAVLYIDAEKAKRLRREAVICYLNDPGCVDQAEVEKQIAEFSDQWFYDHCDLGVFDGHNPNQRFDPQALRVNEIEAVIEDVVYLVNRRWFVTLRNDEMRHLDITDFQGVLSMEPDRYDNVYIE